MKDQLVNGIQFWTVESAKPGAHARRRRSLSGEHDHTATGKSMGVRPQGHVRRQFEIPDGVCAGTAA